MVFKVKCVDYLPNYLHLNVYADKMRGLNVDHACDLDFVLDGFSLTLLVF